MKYKILISKYYNDSIWSELYFTCTSHILSYLNDFLDLKITENELGGIHTINENIINIEILK